MENNDNIPITNFDAIRKEALSIIDMKGCPDAVKDVFIRMVADEKSLVDVHKALTILSIHSNAYVQFVDKARQFIIAGLIMDILKGDGE